MAQTAEGLDCAHNLPHQDSIQSVAFSPDGQFIVSASADFTRG
ncbi:hypothetical protein [Laspinema palackyanum]